MKISDCIFNIFTMIGKYNNHYRQVSGFDVYNEQDFLSELESILLTEEILKSKFDFHNASTNSNDVFAKVIYPAKFANIVDGSNIEQRQMVKPPTYLIIKLDEGEGRFTTYLYHDNNKIYIAEQSYVHELQLLLFTLTGNFPVIKF